MVGSTKPRAVGLNHVALEVGDIEEALAFYGLGSTFNCVARAGRWPSSILATNSSRCRRDANSPPMTAVMSASLSMTRRRRAPPSRRRGSSRSGGPFLDFRDPWGNRIEIVSYDNIQFTKAPNVLRGMGLEQLTKNESAKNELAEKGMAVS